LRTPRPIRRQLRSVINVVLGVIARSFSTVRISASCSSAIILPRFSPVTSKMFCVWTRNSCRQFATTERQLYQFVHRSSLELLVAIHLGQTELK
jgi:hypothetical protein